MTIKTKVESFLRSSICDKVGHKGSIQFIEGLSEPKLSGRGFYWTTPGGKTIYHPSSYRWPKVYHGSTYNITCGIKWFDDKLKLPRGYVWGVDKLGVHIRRRHDQEKYHPTYWEMIKGGNELAKLLRLAVFKRKLARRSEKEFIKELNKDYRVTLQDSYNAGNCQLGTALFIKNSFGIKPDLNNNINVKALYEYSINNPIYKEQIINSIKCAIDRENSVQI